MKVLALTTVPHARGAHVRVRAAPSQTCVASSFFVTMHNNRSVNDVRTTPLHAGLSCRRAKSCDE
eukprot:469522-Prymnesium_polylepis.1